MWTSDLGDEPSEWAEEVESDVLVRMARTLSHAGLAMPPIPANLYERLLETEMGWAWSTTAKLDSFSLYTQPVAVDDHGGPPGLDLEWALDETTPDFAAFGFRGHGINSYGLGFVLRWGSLFIFNQLGWGGIDDSEWTTSFVNEVTVALAALLEEIEPSIHAEPHAAEYGLIFSDYRNVASIRTPETPREHAADTVSGGWVDLARHFEENVRQIPESTVAVSLVDYVRKMAELRDKYQTIYDLPEPDIA